MVPTIRLRLRGELTQAGHAAVCRMIDAEEEPEQGDPLRHEFWAIQERYGSTLTHCHRLTV